MRQRVRSTLQELAPAHSTRDCSSGGKWCKTEEASNLRVQRIAALDSGHRWLRQRGSRRQCLAPPRCSAWHARVQDPAGSWRTRVRPAAMSEVGAVDKINLK
ncbi:hypothetical protein J3E69DRAFT_339109 [Trichoderma sp. SZMC 28015]